MLQAAAMLVGLWAVWLLLAPAPLSFEHLGLGAAVAVMAAALSVRFGGWRDVGVQPGLAWLRVRSAAEGLRAALVTSRAAMAADISLRPALIRIKPRPAPAAVKAAFADAVSASPGWLAVESDADGLLVHVIDEDAVEAHQISALEDGVRAAFGLRGQS